MGETGGRGVGPTIVMITKCPVAFYNLVDNSGTDLRWTQRTETMSRILDICCVILVVRLQWRLQDPRYQPRMTPKTVRWTSLGKVETIL